MERMCGLRAARCRAAYVNEGSGCGRARPDARRAPVGKRIGRGLTPMRDKPNTGKHQGCGMLRLGPVDIGRPVVHQLAAALEQV